MLTKIWQRIWEKVKEPLGNALEKNTFVIIHVDATLNKVVCTICVHTYLVERNVN